MTIHPWDIVGLRYVNKINSLETIQNILTKGVRMSLSEWGSNFIREVHLKWESFKGTNPLFDSGFSVFYSPLKISPKIMLIGFNPGGGPESFDLKNALTIPTKHDYFAEDYPLAKKMRAIFKNMNQEELLADSVKLNLIFFRTTDMEQWNQLEPLVRKDIEAFCIQKGKEAILHLKPKVILAEGIQTYLQLKRALDVKADDRIFESKGRSLFIENKFNETKLLGIIHPSGARVSNEEWVLITDNLKNAICD
jgi:hypothetical protein